MRNGALFLACLPALAGLSSSCRAQAPAAPPVILVKMDWPLLFAYGTWEKRARVADGAALLDAEGMTPKGGAGVNLDSVLDLRAQADDSPALRVRVGPRNTLKTLRLTLQDAGGHTGTWSFPLTLNAAPGSGFVVVMPTDGASFARPNEIGKTGLPDLSHIMQWQLMGDWGGDGQVDVRVSAILAAAPDAAIIQARQALARKDTDVRAQATQDRQAAREKYGKTTALSPVVEAVYAAAPDVLALQIHSGKITPAHLSRYTPQPGDTTKAHDGATTLLRGGQEAGYLIGPKHDGLVTMEGFAGDPLLTQEADNAANYRVTSTDDPAYAQAVRPLAVHRKSKPDDWQQPKRANLTWRHLVYLILPKPLTLGRTYTVTLENVNVQTPTVTLAFDPTRVWSESVHVNQVGFRPDDPRKRAFLSLWMGDGGGYDFPPNLPFHLVAAATGKSVYAGRVGNTWAADKPEKMHTPRNFNGTSVAPLDFSEFHTPGRYRVAVDGVGCSYPFEIGPGVWEKAFQVQMKGFYNQRSGIALGPPYSRFVRPADFRPGVPGTMPITQSTYSNLDGGDPQKGLAKGDTGRPVPEAWGGYHDAGDWNPRRITHMRTTTFWQLQLLEMFPAYFKTLPLHIPRDSPAPDLLNECRFELGLFHRLQRPDGGVPAGIETNGDPIDGEVSWKQSMPAYVYAPDVQSSYLYAAVAARMARVLAAYAPAEAKTYQASAVKVMAWAEADRAKRQASGTWAKLPGDVTDDRNLAAVEVYTLTGDTRWHDIFLQDSTLKSAVPSPFHGSLQRRDAAFAYALLPAKLADPQIKANAARALIADADGALIYAQNNAWGIASNDPGKPQFLGFYSTPHGAVSLLRAYHLTRDARYLSGALQACLFPAGANPGNMVYTSGVGANSVRHPLNLDSRLTGQPAPIGLTVYGNVDLARWGDQTWITWPITYYFGTLSQPNPLEWPTSEAYFDVFFMPGLNEFTMDQTMGPNAYVWGYLAARK
jgi:endoglucanase